LTKIFASQGADKRDGGMLVRTMWMVGWGETGEYTAYDAEIHVGECYGPEASRATVLVLWIDCRQRKTETPKEADFGDIQQPVNLKFFLKFY